MRVALRRFCARGGEESRLLLGFLRAEPASSRFHNELKPFADLHSQLEEARQCVAGCAAEDAPFYRSEAALIAEQLEAEAARVVAEVLAHEQQSELSEVRGALVELRQAAGGDESLLFAQELFDAYCAFVPGWNIRVEQLSAAGGRALRFRARGEQAYPRLRCEAGVHKVIRVPETDAKGRLHSSTVSVVVLPEIPFEFRLNEKELKFEYMRAQGPGGQHVNKTESACRVTHLPTGLAVLIQEDRAQTRNKLRAVEVLREKLYLIEQQRHVARVVEDRKGQMGSGERSDKIRTYNFPQDRITDHRLGRSWSGLKRHLASGEAFAEAVEAVLAEDTQRRKEAFFARLRAAEVAAGAK